ncbi:hypothetical protein C1645_739262 [Glomus cerebriforme]|uniref:Uncharacterized protein n=1 Tax=Glomus cerebriforme TaxID=658196 RepID=A0A397SVH1_9GLOM|nr:hypothetical protein C1645_739262 [Glomus cerebriforme]
MSENKDIQKFIFKICSQILSINSSHILENDDYVYNNIDILLQEEFQRNNVRVMNRYILNDIPNQLYTRQLYIDYDKNTLKNIIPICKNWFKPLVDNLKDVDKRKRSEWIQNYDKNNSVEELKTRLINDDVNDKFIKIIPGFKYLVHIQWEFNDDIDDNNGLIFGSDYGVYLVVETKWLNMNYGKHAQSSRNNARSEVKERAQRFKQFAIAKYKNEAIKVIGATYTNDTENEELQYIDDRDKEIAKIIKTFHINLYVCGIYSGGIATSNQMASGIVKNFEGYIPLELCLIFFKDLIFFFNPYNK